MPLGAGRYDVVLKNGVARLRTDGIPLAGGRLVASPRINLSGARLVLVLDPGPVAERIQLTPEICRDWLKYVAPLLADATSASGRSSSDNQPSASIRAKKGPSSACFKRMAQGTVTSAFIKTSSAEKHIIIQRRGRLKCVAPMSLPP